MSSRWEELTEFQQAFAELWVEKGCLNAQLGGYQVFNRNDLKTGQELADACGYGDEYDQEEDELDGYDGFGFDHFESRLVEKDDEVDWYGWCYNSHGSTYVFTLPKAEFLERVKRLVTELTGETDAERYREYSKLWSKHFGDLKHTSLATW